MTTLNKIEISGFKSIKKMSLDLSAINVLIGANGCGKTNLIESFAFLRAITEGQLQRYVKIAGGAERLIHFGSKNTSEIAFHFYFKDSINQYRISLQPTDLDSLAPTSEIAYYWIKDEYSSPVGTYLKSGNSEAGISTPSEDRVEQYVKAALKKWRVYHFHDTGRSSPLKKVADLDDNRFLRHDGSNLAAFLYLLKQEHPESYQLIRGVVHQMAPFFEDFALEPRELDDQQIRLEWQHSNADEYFDVSAFSDGTLRFVAIATLLLQPERYKPSVILIDEPELGLHPYAITLLGSLVKSASVNSQIILSTQSPFLLDQFSPEDVIVVDRRDSHSRFTRLEKDNLESWLEDYSLGELWEKNELGGRPSG